MKYEGIVTSININLWHFVLDNKITFNVAHWAISNSHRKLPMVGSHVKIENNHHHKSNTGKKIFLCSKAVITYVDLANVMNDELLRKICHYRLGISDLFIVDAISEVIAKFVNYVKSEQILLAILENILKEPSGLAFNCLNNVLPKLKLITPSSLKYMENTSVNSEQSPYYSFKVHSEERGDILIAYIDIEGTLGVPFIKDANLSIPCILTSTNSETLLDISHRWILLKNYKVFTEIYKDAGIRPLHYVFFNIEDVIDLKLADTKIQDYLTESSPNVTYKYSFKFVLLDLTTVLVTQKKRPEFWIKIQYLNKEKTIKYIIMTASYSRIIQFLKRNQVYYMLHCRPLQSINWREIARLTNKTTDILYETTAVIKRIRDANVTIKKEPILTLEELRKDMETLNGLVSFEACIAFKDHVTAIPSKTYKYINSDAFGTPGVKQHVIHFKCNDGEIIRLYLNNWENFLNPIGLLPEMSVIVRNVLVQNKKYLKCTTLTTFEILRYEKSMLHTNLSGECSKITEAPVLKTNLEDSRSKLTFLGFGDLIPIGTLVKANIVKFSIKSMKMHCRCKKCDLITPCDCEHPTPDYKLTMTLYVKDEVGEAFVISHSLNVLKSLLNLKKAENWPLLLSGFEYLGVFAFRSPPPRQSPDKRLLYTSINKLIETASKLSSRLTLTCRKMQSKPRDNNGLPLWYCVN